MIEWIEVLFGIEDLGVPRHIVLEGGSYQWLEVGDKFVQCKV